MRVTLKQISKEMGVSVTTVCKALNNKPKVSEQMRKKIIAKAKELDYKPNKLAQGLARNRRLIGLIIPYYPRTFMRYVVSGIEEIVHDLEDSNIQSIIKQPKNPQEARDAAKKLIAAKVDGIILLANEDLPGLSEAFRDTDARGIPVVGIVSEPLDKTPLVGMVRSNGLVLGRMAAQLLSLCVDKSKQLAVFLPDDVAVIHMECHESFVRESIEQGMSSPLLYRTYFQGEKNSYNVTREALSDNKHIGGIYVASNNSVGVCKCLEDMGRTDIAVIGHDLYPELAACLKRGSLFATLFQNQSLQVKEALKHIVKYITGSNKPFGNIHFRPEVVMISNLECYEGLY